MFCKHCREIIEKRIKYLKGLDRGKKVADFDRVHVIQQLNWLLEMEDKRYKGLGEAVESYEEETR